LVFSAKSFLGENADDNRVYLLAEQFNVIEKKAEVEKGKFATAKEILLVEAKFATAKEIILLEVKCKVSKYKRDMAELSQR